MSFANNMKTALLLGLLMGLCMYIGHLIGGTQGLVMGFLFGGLGNVIAYFLSDKIALATMRAQEVTRQEIPWLVDMVERLAARAGLPMPRVYVCPQPAPNAFATGRNPRHAAVAVTRGMLENFPPEEIEGVIGHELSHVRHRDILITSIAAVLGGMISQLAWFMMWFGGGGSNRERDSSPLAAIGAVLMIVLAPLAAVLIQAAISRSREYEADRLGGELCGEPLKLARALERLEGLNQRIPTDVNPAYNAMFIIEPLSGKSLLNLFSTHPPIEKRIAALRAQAGVL